MNGLSGFKFCHYFRLIKIFEFMRIYEGIMGQKRIIASLYVHLHLKEPTVARYKIGNIRINEEISYYPVLVLAYDNKKLVFRESGTKKPPVQYRASSYTLHGSNSFSIRILSIIYLI